MKPQELRRHTPEELRALLNELRGKLQTMKIELAQGKVKNTAMLRSIRKDIARILTILQERAISPKS